MNTLLIRDMAPSNKPRERLLQKGPDALSDSELIAIILRTGVKNISALNLADGLLKKFGSLKNLCSCSAAVLLKINGVGLSKAASIVVLQEVSKRINTTEQSVRPLIKSPKDVYKTIRNSVYRKKQEHLFMLSLDTKKKLIATDLISIGSSVETIFPLREVLHIALEKNAAYIIIAHNHPSQDVSPSLDDIEVTNNINEACQRVGITFLDHLIVSDSDYFSIKSTNLIKKGGEHDEKNDK